MSHRRGMLSLSLAAMALVVGAGPAAAATKFVACNDGDNLQEAIDAAAAGDTLIVTGECSGGAVISKDLSLLGFFTATPIIRGFSVDNGLPALHVRQGRVRLENLAMRAGYRGQAMLVSGGTVTGRHLDLAGGNQPLSFFDDGFGGGLEVESGAIVTIEDSSIHDNRADSGGAGVQNEGSLTLRRTTVSGNRAVNRTGGGINNSGTILVEDSTISDNVHSQLGGGLYNSGVAHLVRTTVSDNEALIGAGMSNAGDLTVERSAVLNNDAVARIAAHYPIGGGLSMGPGSRAEISTSTFSGNSAKAGGGIWNDDATVTLSASTVSGNSGSAGGSGFDGTTGTVWAESTALSGNDNVDCSGGQIWVSDGANFFDLTCGPQSPGPGDVKGDDPRLNRAADNGGPTATMKPLAGSPLHDAGRCLRSTDQRNVPRPQGAACDIGAYENRPPSNPGAPRLVAGGSTNQGSFTLGSDAATDPDRDPLDYRLERRDEDDPAWARLGTLSPGTAAVLTAEPEGTQAYRWVATDGNAVVASSASRVVVDRTAPAAPSITADRAAGFVDGQGEPWFADTVDVTVSPGADPSLPDGSRASGTVSPAAVTYTFDTAGRHETSERSVDAAGNESAPATLVVHVDDTSPDVVLDACPARLVFGSSRSVGWTASDTGSGLTGPASGTAALDTSKAGEMTTTVRAADRVGHTGSASCTYSVTYPFTGFGAPLNKAYPQLNKTNGGKVVPVEFGLGGDHGLNVLVGAPTVTPISCDTMEPTAEAREAIAVRPLSYDAVKGTYAFWWQTSKDWKKTCAELAVALDDGTTHRANVRFN